MQSLDPNKAHEHSEHTHAQNMWQIYNKSSPNYLQIMPSEGLFFQRMEKSKCCSCP